MGIEIIGKLTQKNNGDFKLVDLENVDYDGTGKSAKQELEKKIEEAKNSSTPSISKILSSSLSPFSIVILIAFSGSAPSIFSLHSITRMPLSM